MWFPGRNSVWGKAAALTALLFLLLALPAPARAFDAKAFTDEALGQIKKPWTGSLEGMIKRRVIRALVVYNKTGYFLDGARQMGVTYEALKRFEAELNRKLGARHLKIHIVFIPVARDQLLPYLVEGRGDIAAANLTITSDRLKTADFTDPFYDGVKELVVTGPGAPPLKSLDDLSGRTIYVRRSSSYYNSLMKLNRKLKEAGRALVRIQEADERLETEDILEMANAGLIPITAADNYLADFWSQIFPKIKVHRDLALRSGGKLAWAVRKGDVKLKEALNRFIKKNKKGTLFGNVLLRRYLRSTKWVRNSMSPEHMKRFGRTIKFFRKYAGKYGFDWLMITALAYQESGLDQSKRSPAGAVGVMQLLPSTAAGPPVSIKNIIKLNNNIHAGVKYLRFIYDRYFKGQKDMSALNKVLFTFASYNAGPARVAGLRKKAARMGLDPNKWFQNVEAAAARDIGRETVQYVSNIFK